MPFQPGRSGNPHGSRRRTLISDALNLELASVDPTDPAARTKARRVAEKLVELAMAGLPEAIRIVLERTEGKVAQPLEAEVAGELVIRWADSGQRSVVGGRTRAGSHDEQRSSSDHCSPATDS